MNLNQLRHFIEVAREQHLSKAAIRLHISASALSHSIAQFEEDLGTKLFLRERNRIFLTEAGKSLYEKGPALLNAVEECRQGVLGNKSIAIKGHLRIGAPLTLAKEKVLKVCNSLSKKNPDISFELKVLGSSQVIEGLLKNDLDIGLIRGSSTHPQIRSELLLKEKLLFAVRERHPLLKASSSMREKGLQNYTSCAPVTSGSQFPAPHPKMQERGLIPKIDFLYDTSYEIAIERLRSTDSWTLLPESVIHSSKGVEVLSLKNWDMESSVYLVWNLADRSRYLREEFHKTLLLL